MKTVNPTTNEPIETYEEYDNETVERLLSRASETFDSWQRQDITERQALVGSLADVLRENKERYAVLMTREVGKPIEQSRAELDKCAWVCEFYAERAAEFLQDERIGVHPQARTNNNGQACIAAKRFIIVEDVYEEFRDEFVQEMASLTVGDPMDEATDIGPIARADLLDTLDQQVQASLDAGATALISGEPFDGDGNYYPPTVLVNTPEDCPASCDELFGPVASLFVVENEEEAIECANSTEYGLGASVWTSDVERGERVAGELDAGAAFVNELVQSHPKLPFGGVKKSGYGRELAADGIREFTNKKTVWVSPADGLD